MKRIVMEICSFILVLTLLILIVSDALSFKYGDGILGIEYLYEQEDNSVDALFLGSSHAFEDINTQVLFDDYGIAAYILSGSVQPFWNSYYYLKEALKTQTPKVVVLEGYAATQPFEYSDHSRIIKNNLGIKDPFTLMESLKVSSPPEDLADYLLSYRVWHSRYSQIDASDFKEYYEKPIFKYYKGFGINFDTTSYDMPDVGSFTGECEITAKEEKYFRMIIEHCQEQGIPIVVTISPYVLSIADQQRFNYLERICAEYGIPFVNYNSSEKYAEMGFDFSTDMADAGHLNYLGNVKYTKKIAENILSIYELPDRRSDLNYDSWKMHSKDITERTDDFLLSSSIDALDFVSRLKDNDDYICYLFPISQASQINNKTGLFSTENSTETEIANGSIYCLENGTLSRCNRTLDWKYKREIDNKYLSAEFKLQNIDTNTAIQANLSFGNNQYICDQPGVFILVYNTFTRSLICVKRLVVNAEGSVDVVAVS